ncbi:YpiF family protein [Anoxybacillus sp. ST70]|uniref:YpiF family protein n=1 Tax=Anoxybacillus sp. ST70 TaxID=2864180 RepID=UPI001C6FB28F|nr:YpiF family protein [Anoxybacillus sp. ST70]MBW9218177.1 YpiF family protein [Anoxybacillus sp. ST70]
MKWTAKDVDMYHQAKEYVDTALVPCIPIGSTSMKAFAEMSEHTLFITNEVERQFKGRVMLFPPLTYFVQEQIQARVHEWTNVLKQAGFQHVCFVTSHADIADESFIYVPALPLEHADEAYKQKVVRQQVEQVMDALVAKWTLKN